MKRTSIAIILWLISFASVPVFAQNSLPEITVKNLNGRIIVSWLNDYKQPITNIFIQRSYDSLKHFSTIGSVLNPLNKENGYPDINPPYNKMYYRVSISFEGGAYIIGPSTRPVKEIPEPVVVDEPDDKDSNAVSIYVPPPPRTTPKNNPSQPVPVPVTHYPWQLNQSIDSSVIIPKKDEITYPSNRIYTGKHNNVVIYLPGAVQKKYNVKFYDEEDKFLFELNRIAEDFLIIEKVNFIHAGWFHFEIFDNGKLIEKNRFYIPKDGKNNNR